jgi:hypothetical protein
MRHTLECALSTRRFDSHHSPSIRVADILLGKDFDATEDVKRKDVCGSLHQRRVNEGMVLTFVFTINCINSGGVTKSENKTTHKSPKIIVGWHTVYTATHNCLTVLLVAAD